MILAVDVDYRQNKAVVAGVCFEHWSDESPLLVVRTDVADVEPYEPGFFYKRELPCILKLIEAHELSPDLIVVDGFVVLGDDAKPGLGMHLYNALKGKIPIIGVAKRRFKDTETTAEVFRGESKNPLYVTTAGIDDEIARDFIQTMHGKHRIPTLLKLVDSECRAI